MPPRSQKRVFSLAGFGKTAHPGTGMGSQPIAKRPRTNPVVLETERRDCPSQVSSALFTFTHDLGTTLPASINKPNQMPLTTSVSASQQEEVAVENRESAVNIEPEQLRKKRKSGKGQNEMLQDWLKDCAEIYLQRLLATETLPAAGSCSVCTTTTDLYRCDDCLSNALYCCGCLHASHRVTPCHRWRKWNGQFFEAVSSQATGYVFHLGHNGQPCSLGTERLMLLLDVNGHHEIVCKFCEHVGHSDPAGQLLNARIYPASDKRPSTGFTFQLLKLTHLAEVEGKLSMQRFYDMLVQQTNAAFPHRVPNRYREHMRVAREWNLLTLLKRGGVWSTSSTHRQPFDLVLRCPSCPQMNINVCMSDITPANAHLFVLHMNYDGSFQLFRKDKPVDCWDIALTDQQLYFVRDADLQAHIEMADVTSRNQTTRQAECNNHRAAESQWVKFTGLAETGVGSVTCARHSFFMPGGSTSYTTGERYVYADYVLGSVIDQTLRTGLSRVGVHYDIMCHYSVRMWDRWASLKLPLRPLSPNMFEAFIRAIGKFHIAAHQESCFLRYSLNNLSGVGRLDGEGAERCWADLNLASHTTSERGRGARLDALNGVMHHWNWCKLTGQVSLLLTQSRNAKQMVLEHKGSWEEFHSGISSRLTSQWESMSTEPYLENGKWTSVFALSQRHAPSIANVMDKLKSEELGRALLGLAKAPPPGCAEWVLTGIRLESTQLTLRRDIKAFGSKLSPGQSLNVSSRRKALAKALSKHREMASRFCPSPDSTTARAVDGEPGEPESLSTLLPSSYPPGSTQKGNFNSVAEVERTLRRIMCQTTLKEFRTSAANKAHLTTVKTSRHRTTQSKLRAQGSLDSATDDVAWAKTRYNEHRNRLMQLGGSDEDRASYQLLRETDLQEIHVMFMAERRLGEGTRSIPWYWKVSLVNRDGTSAAEETLSALATEDYEDGLRLQWFTARERLRRWEEERQWIQREAASLVLSFTHRAKSWEDMSRVEPVVTQAYCRRQAAIWKQLTHDAAQRLLPVLQDSSIASQPLVTRVMVKVSELLGPV